jgi:serine/threonine protein kinase
LPRTAVDPADVAASAPTGDTPARVGRYEILGHLATGGMARIYLAKAGGIGAFERYVVLKTISPERAGDQRFVTMFLDEARLAATLNHQNIAQVYEVDEADGNLFITMEYVHGENLRHILESTLRKGWTIPIELAVMIASSAAAGLHHAHERKGKNGQPLNIVHRDVSPANIMVGFDGSVKLLDFGIAKAEERSTKTQQGTIKGKYGYMSPEQCRGKPIDRRSDIFALGIILYEITTLRRAFRGNDDFDTMKRIVNGDLLPPSTAVPGYPRELEAIVLTAMARDPDYRFQTTQEMLEALDAFLQRAKLSGAPSAMARFMTQLFGSRREPWVDSGVAAGEARVAQGADDDDGGPALPDAGGDRTEINDGEHDSLSVPTQDLAPSSSTADAATDSLSDTTAVVERQDEPVDDHGHGGGHGGHGHGHGHGGVHQTLRDVDTRELEARTTRERTAPPHEQTTARNSTLDPATLPEPTAWVPPRPRPRDSDAAAWSQPNQPLPQEHASRRSGPVPSTPGEVMPRALSQPGMAAQGVPNRPTERGIGGPDARRSGQLVAPVGTPGGMRASSASDAPLPAMQPPAPVPQPQMPTTAELALAGDAVPSVRPSRAGMYILLAVLIAVIAVVAGSIALGMMNQSSHGDGNGSGSGSAAVAPP